MQFRDEDFDVYVTENALAIVHRGEHISNAQMFGVDWDGPSHSAMHATVFDALAPTRLPARVSGDAPRRSVCGYLLGCVFAEPAVWICVGWALGWFVFRAWR